MKKIKWKLNIDWKSKLIDLLIVIIGITIAFQLNNLNESNKSDNKEKDYLESFYEENRDNEASLSSALEFSITNKNDIDTLKQILLSKNYEDDRIKNISASMLALSYFDPSLTTMENITASGEFELIGDIEFRKNIIDTYKSFKTTSQLEDLLYDFVDQYLTPFFFENVRISDFTPLKEDYIKEAQFENIVMVYDVLLTQKITGYQKNLENVRQLNQLLIAARK